MMNGALSSPVMILLITGLIILFITLVIGLGRAVVGPTAEDRFSSLLLLGSGGVALILLLAILLNMPSLYDVALVLAMLAVVMTVAVSRGRANHD